MAEVRSGATHAYGYDAAGRMATFQINGFLQASYKYDAMGRQAIRTLTAGPVTIHSVFDSQGRRIAEYNETSGALIREYIWNGWEPVALIEGGVVYFVRADHIGRPVFATNASGVKVWSATYLPFGEVHVANGALPDNRFPGQWYQSESGLHQNWMRDYDPTTGRYLQADPLGLVDGASVYGYVRQNPGRWVDPRGLFTEAALSSCAFGGPYNPFCDAAVVVNLCKWVIIGGMWIFLGPEGDTPCENCTESRGFPPGYWPGDKGAEEWGRRNGVSPKDARRDFHKKKQQNKGSGAAEDLGVNPDTGDIVDGNGESVGNMDD